LYNVDFADALSGLTTAQYRVTSQSGQAGAVFKDWTDIYSITAGTAAYTDDWPADFAALQEWATNYVSARGYDLLGRSVSVADVFHVWKDTTPPPVPGLAAPADGAFYSTATVAFSWPAVSDLKSGLAGYELELSTSADFTPLIYSSFTANLSVSVNNLSGPQYWRVRSKDNLANYSGFASTRAFYVDLSSPVITNNQSSPTGWYTADPGAVFDVDFADLVSGLTTAQYRITSAAAGGGTVLKDWTDIYSNWLGTPAYTNNWAVDFAALNDGLNFVSVRGFDRVPLSSAVDAFVIRKDTTAPFVVNNQAGDNNWRSAPGALYNVDFADLASGIATAQYLVTSQPLGAGAVLKAWADIVAATS
ncbi:MAG: hypothetical protein AAB359_02000, partial [Elusimicrobiota bacterium]